MSQTTAPQLTPLDLSSCDREPIHIPGAIQPHGILLAVEGPDLTIVQISDNCEELLGQTPEKLLGHSLNSLLRHDSAARLKECLVECTTATSSQRLLEIARENQEPITLSASAHHSGDLTIIELECVAAVVANNEQDVLTFMGKCRLASRLMGQCGSVEELSQVLAQELRSLTGYDRVMVYQFDEEWNGAVIAEDLAVGLEPFLGLHYPATDIPSQARAMFLLNGLRAIPDAHYQPATLFPPAHPRTGCPLDLSRAHLRSVSPIHLEYLRNMGVRASLTISLMVDGKLWGLIACHHLSPFFPSPLLREVCELFGKTASLQLNEQLQAAGKSGAEHSREVLRRLANRVRSADSIVPALLEAPEDLLALTNAQGAVLWRDGEAFPVGVTPPAEALASFQRWVADATADPVYFTDRLPKRFQEAEGHAAVASGMLALALTRSPDVYILWFRPEVIQTVDWAGNPNKSVESNSSEGRLRPRQSFALWRESVRNRSQPWITSEIEAVKQLHSILQDRLARTAEQLRRLLPICAWCRKVRSDETYWQQVEEYVGQHLSIDFTHGICPQCLVKQLEAE